MTIRYPNGNQFYEQPASSNTHNDSIDFSNRGMTLEDEINKSNQYYLKNGIAVIHKKPTPIQIVSVDYPKRSAARIKEAYFRRRRRQITMASIRENISTLMQRKPKAKLLFL